jgi:hypothetical protein
MADNMDPHVIKLQVESEPDKDSDRGENSVASRKGLFEKVNYHFPKYVPDRSMRFQSLPTEILLKIVACLDPSLDIRALRNIRKVFWDTNIGFLGEVAEQMLEEQRTQFLETNFWHCVCKVDGHFHDLDNFMGRQYVCEKEDIGDDKWVSTANVRRPSDVLSLIVVL